MTDQIYLDNNATTQLDPKVLAACLEQLEGPPSNASSIHQLGQRAKRTLQKSRERIAHYLGCDYEEVIFTSGATEGLNMTIRGFLSPLITKGKIISSAIEHSAIYEPLIKLKEEGYRVDFMPVNKGVIDPKSIEKAIDETTQLLVFSAVNSETGIITDWEKISKIADKAKLPLIIDGVAIMGKEKLSNIPKGVSAMCFSGHKFHAPKGIGITILKDNRPFSPMIFGGHQEFDKRAGTENIPSIVGISTAIELIYSDVKSFDKMRALRDLFEKKLTEKLPDIIIHGKDEQRASNTSNICFNGIAADHLLMSLDQKQVYASHGSACSSGSIEPSRVLLEMGIDKEIVKSSVRFSLSRFTTYDEIEKAASIIIETVLELRS